MKRIIGAAQGLARNQRGGVRPAVYIMCFVLVVFGMALAIFLLLLLVTESDVAKEPASFVPSDISLALNPSETDLETGMSVVISVTSEAWRAAQLTWSLDPPLGSGILSSNSDPTVVYTAPEQAGSVTVSVEGEIGGQKGSSEISFTVAELKPRPFLGMRFNNTPTGAIRVEKVIAGTPAYSAGILDDDKIVAIDGREIISGIMFLDLLQEYSPGDEIILIIHRDGAPFRLPSPPSVLEITVILGEW